MSAHPNGAKKVLQALLLSRAGQLQAYRELLEVVLDGECNASGCFQARSPTGAPVNIQVREAETEDEKQWVQDRSEGLYQLVLEAQQDKDLGNGILLRKRTSKISG